MRKLLLVVTSIIFLGLYSCSSTGQSSDGFEISGKIENGQGKTVYLDNFGNTKPVPVDSMVIAEDGSYKLSSTTPFADFFVIRLDNNQFAYLVIDSLDKVTINGNYDDFATSYTVEGSEESKRLQNVNKEMQNVYNQLNSIWQELQTHKGEPGFDSLRAATQPKFDSLTNGIKTYIKNVIDEKPGSLVSYYALFQQLGQNNPILNPSDEEDLKYYEKVDEGLQKNLPKSAITKQLHSMLLQIKQQIEAEKIANANTAIGTEAPDIELPGPDGKIHKLSDLRGKYVLLDFWAAWCRPCRGENPNVVAAYKKYKDKGFTVFQVSLDKNKEDWIKAIKHDGLGDWTHVSDLKYWQSEAARLYNIQSIPSNFLIDPEGKIVAKQLRGPALTAKLSELLD